MSWFTCTALVGEGGRTRRTQRTAPFGFTNHQGFTISPSLLEGATTPIGNALHQQKPITKPADPSAELLTALTRHILYPVFALGVANNRINRPKLYAPNPWAPASSYSHLATYPLTTRRS